MKSVIKYTTLTNPDVFPTSQIISDYLGTRFRLWDNLFKNIESQYPELQGSWKYYRDVKSWLFRLCKGTRTIMWLSLIDNTFRCTFYFNQKNKSLVQTSSLPQEIKDTFAKINKDKKFKNLILFIKDDKDVHYTLTLI